MIPTRAVTTVDPFTLSLHPALDMVSKLQAGFKADPSLLAHIDAVADAVMREHPGLTVSRTDAIVMLITEALTARGVDWRAASDATSTTSKRSPAAPKKGTKKARKP